jgi:hypothetical protein
MFFFIAFLVFARGDMPLASTLREQLQREAAKWAATEAKSESYEACNCFRTVSHRTADSAESGRALPHSKSCRHGEYLTQSRQRLGVRQCSAAF